MIIIPIIVSIVSFLSFLYVMTERDHWKNKAQQYERIMDQLMPQIQKFKQILDDDMERKIERLKKMMKLTWSHMHFNETHKN